MTDWDNLWPRRNGPPCQDCHPGVIFRAKISILTPYAREPGGEKLPKAFAILVNIVTGYLNGAGLGALSLEFLSNHSDSPGQTALLALLLIGPLGALLGLLIAASEEDAKTTRSA